MMRIINFIILNSIFFFTHFICFSASYEDNDYIKDRDESKKQQFIIDKASCDINENMTLLANLFIKKQLGEGNVQYYYATIADRIPSQPISVIKLMSVTNINVEKMCPRYYFDDGTDEFMIKYWEEKAIKSLDSFKFVYDNEEKIRVDCLNAIRKSFNRFK